MWCDWKKTDNPVYNRLMEQFVERVAKYSRGGSYEARRIKLNKFKQFIIFISQCYTTEDLRNIQPKHIAAYAKHRRSEGMAEITILSDLSVIRWWINQIPWRRFDMPENERIFELEARLHEKSFVTEIKEKYRRKERTRRRIQKPGGSV